MKLNLGCGYNKLPGWVNVDLFNECEPDEVFDLEKLPWPWPNDSVEHAIFFHSLEHMGHDTNTFLGIMKELYRVCHHDAQIEITVPHPRHDTFIDDPTHVRMITPGTLSMFDSRICDEIKRRGSSETRLAHYIHVDFQLLDHRAVIAHPYSKQYEDGLLTDQDIARISNQMNNVIVEYQISMAVMKPPRTSSISQAPIPLKTLTSVS